MRKILSIFISCSILLSSCMLQTPKNRLPDINESDKKLDAKLNLLPSPMAYDPTDDNSNISAKVNNKNADTNGDVSSISPSNTSQDSSLASDEKILRELAFIQENLKLGMTSKQVSDLFEKRYKVYVLQKQADELWKYGKLFIYSELNDPIKINMGDTFIADGYKGIITDISEKSFTVKSDKGVSGEVDKYILYGTLNSFYEMFLKPRKVGLALDTFFKEDDTLYFARIDLVYGKENKR
jgi:hypothetical protein